MVRGRTAMAVCAGGLVVALSACASPGAPLLSEDQRVGIRAQIEGQAAARYVGATGATTTPGYDFGPTVADHDWPAVQTDCLLDRGFSVAVQGSFVVLLDGATVHDADFAQAEFQCAVLHPRLSSVATYLDRRQLGALYDYYTQYVVPCLRVAGAVTTAPPPRAEFVSDFFSFPWHPFDAVWSSNPADPHAAELERWCPAVPRWLDLGS